MTTSDTFLVEIGCEELPAKVQLPLSQQFASLVRAQLTDNELAFTDMHAYVTPRRLALCITELAKFSKAKTIIRKGPSLQAAFGANHQPTPACLGFARSCGVDVSELQQEQDGTDIRLIYREQRAGEASSHLMPAIIAAAIKKLAISKPMRWGDSDVSFIRPVLWTVMLHGQEIIPCELLGKTANRFTYGHRFHHPESIELKHADDYSAKLAEAHVLADFHTRRKTIAEQIRAISANQVHIDEELLTEVTGLVEWPVALQGKFDQRFLDIPQEAIITAMQSHQKYFPLLKNGVLQAAFITVSNINSKNPQQVIQGNERVLRARLSDAEFFYHTDLKTTLESRLTALKDVVFQTKLGSMYAKMLRTCKLAEFITKQLAADTSIAGRAAMLAKADLMSAMVGEFPELQGIMGYYYALADGENPPIANTIKEHYLPRFAGDTLPMTKESAAVAIADKLDTIVGLFAIGQPPTGERDPFALRRQAIGILRICIEQQLPLDLSELTQFAFQNFTIEDKNPRTESEVIDFILERLRAIYQEQQIDTTIFNAVLAVKPTSPHDFAGRINAVSHFLQLPEAMSLAAANKRVNNILKKQGDGFSHRQLNVDLLSEPAEKALAQALEHASKNISSLYAAQNYTQSLLQLANLKTPVDQFFDQVLVMTEDDQLRENRLILLTQLRDLFSQVADISLLAVK